MNSFFTKYEWATYGRRESARELWKKCQEQSARLPLFKKPIRFSLVMAVPESAAPEDFFWTWESIQNQSYSDWDLVVVLDPTQDKEVFLTLCEDKRVRFLRTQHPLSLPAMKNLALAEIAGDYAGILSPGDILNPSLLFHFALTLQKEESELLYCNEIFNEGSHEKLFSKPEYSYLSLLNQNYLGRFWVAKKELFGHSPFDESAGEWEEHLFLIEKAKLDSSWKLIPVYGVLREEPEAIPVPESVFQRVTEIVNRSGFTSNLLKRETGWDVQPDSSVAVQSLVSVIVCFRDKADWTKECLKRLVDFVGPVKTEVILVNNQSKSREIKKIRTFLEDYSLPHRLVEYAHPFNFGHMHNWAIENYTSGEFLFLLNNDVFLNGKSQMKDMLGWAVLPFVGTVGCLLKYKDGRVQHAGLTAYLGGESRLVRIGNEQSDASFLKKTREVFGNTFAACLMKRSTYQKLGGFRELDLANGYGDVAFNLDCQREGLKNIHLGYLEGMHLESASRGMNYEYWEECILEREYPDLLQKMVRYDFGYNRMPVSSSLLRDAATYTKGKLRQRFPWLKDVKRSLVQVKTGMKHLQKNYEN